MRTFVSIDMPKEIKDNLFNIQKFIPRNITKINWVSKKNLHITLKFIGEVDEEKLKLIKNRLKEIKFKPFEVSLNELGFYLFKGKPRVVRIDFVNGEKIIGLQKKIDEVLLDLGTKDQKFTPHLTLGRIKLVKKEKEFLKKIKEIEFNKDKFEINGFSLVQSILTKDGPKYKVLEDFKS